MNKGIEWDAEEYVTYQRNGWWYFGVVAVAAVLGILTIWLGWTYLILVALSTIVVIVKSLRPARRIHYRIEGDSLFEGEQEHKFEDFKAFGILKEGEHFAAILIPKKRFGMQVKAYFPEANGEEITDALGVKLPMEEVKEDFLDKIVDFLRI